MRRVVETLLVLSLGALIFAAPTITSSGGVRWTLQILSAAAIGILALRSFRRMLGYRSEGSGSDTSHQFPRSAQRSSHWEDVDPLGDEARLLGLKRWIWGFCVVSALSLVLIVVGDSTVRVFGSVVLCFSLVMLIPLMSSARSSRRRVREGRALVPGDPYRPEGIISTDTDAP